VTRHSWLLPGLAVVALGLVLVAPALNAAPRRPAVERSTKSEPRRTQRALPFAKDEVVVLADEGILEKGSGGGPIVRDARIAEVLARLGLDRARPAGPARDPATSRKTAGWILTSGRVGFDPVHASRALQATGAFRAVSPNYRFGLLATVPNDLYVIYQWYVDDGSYGDIRLPLAWDIGQGDTSVVIAIMDTGVDTSHPDLATKIWHNAAEIAGNGFDDDGNGLIDDVEGWDFGMNDADPKTEYTSDGSGIDVGFHGTFCAGIAAAATNNDEGIAGAGWDCRIMPLKVSHPDSGISSSAIAGAFEYAIDKGASVISMSFGGPGDPGVPEFFQALADMATQAGALCVAAAGNDGDSTRVYPAACENVLSVGATDYGNGRAEFSNWGPWVDVAAPGSFMWSTIAQNYTLTELDQLIYIILFGWDGVSPYMYGDGTSFACPLVAGVCGLVRARYPYLTPQVVARHVVATGDPVSFDLPVGTKVNAFAALNGVPTAVAVAERAPSRALVSAAPNPIAGAGSIRFVLAGPGRARLVLYDASGRRVRGLQDATFPAGAHVVPWDGRDDRGRRVASGVYFARLECGGGSVNAKIVVVGE
jgi:subtilisin family serine protease